MNSIEKEFAIDGFIKNEQIAYVHEGYILTHEQTKSFDELIEMISKANDTITKQYNIKRRMNMAFLDNEYIGGYVGNIINPEMIIEKTIIKGLRKVKQLVGISYKKYGFPQLNYSDREYPSHKILQEFDGELLYQHKRGESIFSNYEDYISIKFNDKLEDVKIINQYITKNNILILVVDKLIEEENTENKFNYDEIMELYSDEVNKYWNEFLEKYKGDTAKSALIRMYEQNGMNLEDIIELIENNNEKNINIDLSSLKITPPEMKVENGKMYTKINKEWVVIC